MNLNLLNRPHDRVTLKNMKSDWLSCLDNDVGFKVTIPSAWLATPNCFNYLYATCDLFAILSVHIK